MSHGDPGNPPPTSATLPTQQGDGRGHHPQRRRGGGPRVGVKIDRTALFTPTHRPPTALRSPSGPATNGRITSCRPPGGENQPSSTSGGHAGARGVATPGLTSTSRTKRPHWEIICRAVHRAGPRRVPSPAPTDGGSSPPQPGRACCAQLRERAGRLFLVLDRWSEQPIPVRCCEQAGSKRWRACTWRCRRELPHD